MPTWGTLQQFEGSARHADDGRKGATSRALTIPTVAMKHRHWFTNAFVANRAASTSAGKGRRHMSAVAMYRSNRDGRRGKSLNRSCASFRSLNFTISRRSIRNQGIKQLLRDLGHRVHCAGECVFVRFGRRGEATQFSNELKRRGSDFFICGRRFEVVQRSNVSTHEKIFS